MGMSFGDENAPLTNTPGLEVSTGVKTPVWQKPSSLRRNFITRLNASASAAGLSPTASTTMLKTSSFGSPFSTYLSMRFLVFGSSLTAAILDLTNLMPYSFFARL